MLKNLFERVRKDRGGGERLFKVRGEEKGTSRAPEKEETASIKREKE